MAYEINGVRGIYDERIKDPSVRYGRNAAANHKQLITSTLDAGIMTKAPILDFRPTIEAQDNNIKQMHAFVEGNDNFLKYQPPLDYEYRYMPEPQNGNIDKKALLGAAYEEMGADAMTVREFENKFLPSGEYTVKPLDINSDGKIDISEYGVSMLAADMYSKQNPSIEKIDGSMNPAGMNIVMEYAHKSNAEAAAKLYSKIYATHKLNEIA